MKLTEQYIKQVIKEEYQAVLAEKKKKKSAKDKMKCNSLAAFVMVSQDTARKSLLLRLVMAEKKE